MPSHYLQTFKLFKTGTYKTVTGIATLDAETDPFKFDRFPRPFTWGFYDGEEFTQTWGDNCTEEIIDTVSRFKGICYAHNGGRFDFHYLIEKYGDYGKIMLINGRIAEFKIGNCRMRDSWLILPVSLKMMEKDDIDYWKMEKEHRNKYRDEISRYLRTDCTSLHKYVSKFIDRFGVRLTLAGTAMKHWEKNHAKPNGIKRPKTFRGFDEKFRAFYYGGRVSCFGGGEQKGDFQVYDINSAYPYAMLHEHPYQSGGDHTYKQKTKGVTDIEMLKGFFEVDADSYGCLPQRGKSGLNFPIGRGTYYATGWELQAGLNTGTVKIHKILKGYIFDKTINFKSYVNEFYEEKKNAEKGSSEYLFSKLMMNSLYGKFAQDGSDYKDYRIAPRRSKLEDGWKHEMDVGNMEIHYRPKDQEYVHFFNVATAASITGFVRALLWETIKSVNAYYCDTDSIICDKTKAIKLGKELGEWDLEADNVKKLAIGGKKLYACFDEKNKCIKKASKGGNLSGSEILEIANGGQVVYSREAPVFSMSAFKAMKSGKPRGYQWLSRTFRKTI